MKQAYQTALVTGGVGFIGSQLVNELAERDFKVIVVDFADPKPKAKNALAMYVKLDIRKPELIDVFLEYKPDVVFHLAAHVAEQNSAADPLTSAKHNILGSLRVFEGAKETKVKKIIFASVLISEPTTPYTISKLAGERYLNYYFHQYEIPYAALRLSNVRDNEQATTAVKELLACLDDSKTGVIQGV